MESIHFLFEQSLFFQKGISIIDIKPLPPAGSDRRYFRLFLSDDTTILYTYNSDIEENDTYFYYTSHFLQKGLNVPQVYTVTEDKSAYLVQDLGEQSLFDEVAAAATFDEHIEKKYQQTLDELLRFQTLGHEGLDYTKAYPIDSFGHTVIHWDLNYFKYYFQRLTKVVVNEARLQQDFDALTNYLLQEDTDFFLFRDFQARNVHFFNDLPYFIDHQGGKKGAAQYDVVSLLYQAKANISESKRASLTDYYLQKLSLVRKVDQKVWMEYFFGYMLIRFLQTLGSYGYRGFYRRKEHFLASIPYQLKNIEWWLSEKRIPIELPELFSVLRQLSSSPELLNLGKSKKSNPSLTVTVTSFSYKKTGYPADDTDNGGGFVFDCRFIHNPGRYEAYKKLTGRDEAVITFFKNESEIDEFLMRVYSIVDPAIENYIERDFQHLTINFGCTGGQHRSVYCADAMAKHINEKYGVRVVLHHIEQEKKNWINEG